MNEYSPEDEKRVKKNKSSNPLILESRFRRILFFGLLIVLVIGLTVALFHRSSPVRRAVAAAPMTDEVGGYKKIHVFVALCDNQHQGIAPVPPAIGNGQDAARNLYWGARYGVKTHMLRSRDWKLLADLPNPKAHVLERLIFTHLGRKAYLVADAYDGAYIKQAISDTIAASAGQAPEAIAINSHRFIFGGGADLLTYIGHDGLIDFPLDLQITRAPGKRKEVMLLCCVSCTYFKPWLEKTGAYPLLWTTQVMCPEAYTFKAALDGWLRGESPQRIHERAAREYSRYQKCSVRAAGVLLKTGL